MIDKKACKPVLSVVGFLMAMCLINEYYYRSILHDFQRNLSQSQIRGQEPPAHNAPQCASKITNESLVYKNPSNESLRGIVFHPDQTVTARLDMPPGSFVRLDSTTVTQFVVVTACSGDHFDESMDMVATVQEQLPGHRVIYYDIGLNDHQVKKLKRLCDVEYRKFNFDLYPGHVRWLKTYSWKPIIIMEVLSEHGGALWLDASIRIRNSIQPMLDLALKNGGIATAHNDSIFIWRVTMPQMYMYFPSDLQKLAWYGGTASGCVLYFKTEFIYWNILHWWALCALEQFCMSPILNKTKCGLNKKPGLMLQSSHLNCHRYDQSALSILLGNLYKFHRSAYTVKYSDSFVHILRHPSEYSTLKYCTVNRQ